MATAIAKLAVKILADATGIKKGVDDAKSALGKFKDWIGSFFEGGLYGAISRTLTSAFSLVGTAIDTLGSKWDQFSGKIDKAAKDARRLGMSVEDMMAFEGIAGEGGVDQGTFMRMMMKARTEFKGNFLEKFIEVGDVIAGMDDANERAKTLQQSFHVLGKNATTLVTVFENGSQAIRDQLKHYHETYSLTSKQTSAVEAANDALQRTGMIWDGFWMRIVASMAPAINSLHRWFHQLGRMIARFGEMIGVVLGDSMLAGVEIMKTLADGFLQFWHIADGLAGLAGMREQFDPEGFRTEFRKALTDFAVRLADGFHDLLVGMVRLGEALSKFGFHLMTSLSHLVGTFNKDAGKALAHGSVAMSDAQLWFQNKRPEIEKLDYGKAVRIALMNAFKNEDAAIARKKALADAAAMKALPAAAVAGSREAWKIEARHLAGNKADAAQAIRKAQLDQLRRIGDGVMKLVPGAQVAKDVVEIIVENL